MSRALAWATEDELDFLRNLGDFTDRGLARGDLLRSYAAAIELRDNWDGINPVAVRQELQVALFAAEIESLGRL